MRWRSVLWVRNSVRRVAILVLITGFLVGGLTFPEPAHGQEYPGKIQILAWFNQYRNIHIPKIGYTNDTPGIPPRFTIEADAAMGNRPSVTFELYHVSGEGSTIAGIPTVDNVEWYTYIAYETETRRPLNNFYFIHNDEEDEYFYYDPEGDIGGVVKGKIGETVGDPEITFRDIGELAAFIMNYADDDFGVFPEDCVGAAGEGIPIRITGPKGKGLVPDPDQNSLLDVNGFGSSRDDALEKAAEMNQNCMNTGENGWLAYWGVDRQSAFSDAGEKGCSLNWIVDGGIVGTVGGLGKNEPPAILADLGITNADQLNPFTRLSLCIYIWTILPFTEWVGDLIVNVGGIANLTPNSIKFPEPIDA